MSYDENRISDLIDGGLIQEKQNREIRAHQMYHVYLNTSEIYQNKLNEMRDSIDDIYKFAELEKELEIILSVFRKVCGLSAQRYGEIKQNEE